ncbi:MAG: hypothetical protein L3J59_05940 [Methylococcaceae bacterium]|nr:hypothetical protein [Methylococcaceae bacterium]
MIIILALLQLVAPFTHAHSHGESTENELHIPGLEYLTTNKDGSCFLSIDHSLVPESTVISVGTAIKQNKAISDSTLDFYLPEKNYSVNFVSKGASIVFDHLMSEPILTAHYTLLPSRASPIATN